MATAAAPANAELLLLQRVEPRHALDHTVRLLEDAIKLGLFRPGSPLPPEREVLAQLKISRATFREALRYLREAGYVASVRGRKGGMFVLERPTRPSSGGARRVARELSPELLDALDYRRVVEPAAAELAAKRARPGDIQNAWKLLDDLHDSEADTYAGKHLRLHVEFARLGGSQLLASAVADVLLRLHTVLSAMPLLEAAIRRKDENHRRILAAIEARNPSEARQRMFNNVLVAERLVRSFVSSPESTRPRR